MQTPESTLRVYVEFEDDQYVAQCIDIDVAGFGPTPDDAIDAFVKAYIRACLVAHHVGQSVDDLPPPADELIQRWSLAAQSRQPSRQFTIPAFEIRPRRRDDSHCDHRHAEALIAA